MPSMNLASPLYSWCDSRGLTAWQAWQFAAHQSGWTVILEQDASQVHTLGGRSWFTLTNFILSEVRGAQNPLDLASTTQSVRAAVI